MFVNGNSGGGYGPAGPYKIQNSLRLRPSASPAILHGWASTHAADTDNRRKTFSFWVKRFGVGVAHCLIAHSFDIQNYWAIYFDASNRLSLINAAAGATNLNKISSRVFRDSTAHMHVCVSVDCTLATAEDRYKIFVNNERITSWATNTIPAVNVLCMSFLKPGGGTWVLALGNRNVNPFPLEGLMSDIHIIDGVALAPTDFAEYDDNGVWIPKRYEGTFGTNGVHVNFSDASTLANLGLDSSGNGLNFSVSGPILTPGSGLFDHLTDTPSNNFANLNNLQPGTGGLIPGGNNTSSIPNTNEIRGNVGVTTGKWYWEVLPNNDGQGLHVGTSPAEGLPISPYYPGSTSLSYGYNGSNGQKVTNGTYSAFGDTFTTNDVLSVALDMDNGSVWFAKNGVWQASGDPAANLNPAFTGISLSVPLTASIGRNNAAAVNPQANVNFGQRPFSYTPPSGFNTICTNNLPSAAIPDPSEHMDVVLGAGASIKALAEAVFPSSYLEWIKDRAGVNNHQLIDSVRGSTAVLQSNTTAAETTYSAPAGSSVGWLWKNGGAPVANTDGSIASQVSVNADAGFSIVTYTGSGANATVGHGLAAVPKFIMVKGRNTTANWAIYHYSVDVGSYLLFTQAAATAGATVWNSTAPTSSVFSVGSAPGTNGVGDSFVAYCFAEVPGYSKFGSYAGNALADGPFLYCGFKPKFILIKRTNVATTSWLILDAERDPVNPVSAWLYPDQNVVEAVSITADFTSVGVKLRATNTTTNTTASGSQYLFMAFAEHPFGGVNVNPANAI